MENIQEIGVALAAVGALYYLYRKFFGPKKKNGKDCDNCH